MLRPYLTVFKDSFHEAFASRVLWMLLAVSTCILAAIAPFRLQVTQATDLQIHSVRRWPQLLEALQQAAAATDTPARTRIWSRGSDEFHKRLANATNTSGSRDPIHRILPRIVDDLNQILAKRDLYDETAWQGTIINGQGRELLDRGIDKLSEEEIKRLNRHLLVAAFPGELSGLPDEQVHLLYFGRTLGGPLPITASMMTPAVNGIVARVMDLFVGTVAVFIAILVTAPIIPTTFEAGAIDLLLSKPVNRQWLFLVKFWGGCVFILLNTAFFIVGIYLIVGWRFQIWNSAILWCIPIFLFLFAVYYSVSAWAGVIWKNATVSIVVTIVFWASCFGVENAKLLVDRVYIEPERIVALASGPDEIVGLNQTGDLVRWSGSQWEIRSTSDRGLRPFARPSQFEDLTYDRAHDEVLYVEKQFRRGPMSVLGPSTNLIRIERSSGVWAKQTPPTPPRGFSDILTLPSGKTAIVAADGVFQLNTAAKSDTPALSVFGVTLLSAKSDFYHPLGPPKTETESGADFRGATLDVKTNEIALLGADHIVRLQGDAAGNLVVAQQYPLPKGLASAQAASNGDTPADEAASVAPAVALSLAGDQLWIARSDGGVDRWEGGAWSEICQADESFKSAPVQSFVSADSQALAVYYANGKLRLIDRTGKDISSQTDITAVARESSDRILFSVSGRKVMELNLVTGQILNRYTPRRDLLHSLYDFALVPLYRVFPKPARLGDVVNSLLSRKSAFSETPDDAEEVLAGSQFWHPVWTSALFMALVLGVTCVYIQRSDI